MSARRQLTIVVIGNVAIVLGLALVVAQFIREALT